MLNFSAKDFPTVLAKNEILLSSNPSSLPTTTPRLLASCELRMQSATLIVKSTSTLSILGNDLNHTPARIAFFLSFAKSNLLSTLFKPCSLSSLPVNITTLLRLNSHTISHKKLVQITHLIFETKNSAKKNLLTNYKSKKHI